MIWSIIPESVIFSNCAENYDLRQVGYQGRQVLIRPLASGQGEIVSLLSTDPADYLLPCFQPGVRFMLR